MATSPQDPAIENTACCGGPPMVTTAVADCSAREEPEPSLTPAERTVHEWLRGLNLKAKVAVLIAHGYLNCDHDTCWMNDILREFERDVASAATSEACGMAGPDRAMLGVAVELTVGRR